MADEKMQALTDEDLDKAAGGVSWQGFKEGVKRHKGKIIGAGATAAAVAGAYLADKHLNEGKGAATILEGGKKAIDAAKGWFGKKSTPEDVAVAEVQADESDMADYARFLKRNNSLMSAGPSDYDDRAEAEKLMDDADYENSIFGH